MLQGRQNYCFVYHKYDIVPGQTNNVIYNLKNARVHQEVRTLINGFCASLSFCVTVRLFYSPREEKTLI